MTETTISTRKPADVTINIAPPAESIYQDTDDICIYCMVSVNRDYSHKCGRCGEYKGIMTVAEAKKAGYATIEEGWL